MTTKIQTMMTNMIDTIAKTLMKNYKTNHNEKLKKQNDETLL